jgi:hypothetical protein
VGSTGTGAARETACATSTRRRDKRTLKVRITIGILSNWRGWHIITSHAPVARKEASGKGQGPDDEGSEWLQYIVFLLSFAYLILINYVIISLVIKNLLTNITIYV